MIDSSTKLNFNRTPLLENFHEYGGTLYVFPSAQEDIGLNLNYRTNSVSLSHYALLDIPTGDTEIFEKYSSLRKNHCNPTFIPGFFGWLKSNTIDKSSYLVLSLQNYAMNFETLLLNQNSYNYSDLHTVSERVFWKWLKETGGIFWKATSNKNYLKEPDENVYYSFRDLEYTYNSVVKCIGTIDAGNSVANEFGMFNETYINIPTSYGKSEVRFKIVSDENYKLGHTYFAGEKLEGYDNIQDGFLGYLGDADGIKNTFSDFCSDTQFKCDYTIQEIESGTNYYKTNNILNASSNEFSKRQIMFDSTPGSDVNYEWVVSNYDGIELVKNVEELAKIEPNIFGDAKSFDDINIPTNPDKNYNFKFNTILLYYTVYDPNGAQSSTNLFGVLFLDNPIIEDCAKNTFSHKFYIPNINKKASSQNDGFGTGYSFRVNIKTSSIYDHTSLTINDKTTTNSVLAEDWNNVIKNLNKAISNMNSNVIITQNIQEKYNQLVSFQDTYLNQIENIRNAVEKYNANIESGFKEFTIHTLNTDRIKASEDSSTRIRVEVFDNDAYKTVASFNSKGLKTKSIDTSLICADDFGVLVNYNPEDESYLPFEYSAEICQRYDKYGDNGNGLQINHENTLDSMLDYMFGSLDKLVDDTEKPDLVIKLDNENNCYLSPESTAFSNPDRKYNLVNLTDGSVDANIECTERIDYVKLIPYVAAELQRVTRNIRDLKMINNMMCNKLRLIINPENSENSFPENITQLIKQREQ